MLYLGTGKSFLIEVIRDAVRSLAGSNEADPVVVVAPTGIAAFNVNGSTIHR
jgi:hypothetical protein